MDAACRLLLVGLGAVFFVALVWGVIAGLLRLRGVTFEGDKAAVDASALFFGQPLYADPTRGYAASVYTPLLPVLGAAFDHLRFWRSWVPLLTFVSSLALAGVAARLAWDRRRRIESLIEAAGMGSFCYLLVGELARGYFWNDRPDQLSWALGVGGVLLARRAMHSNFAAIACVVLLSAAFWTKQTALVAGGATFIILLVAAARRDVTWKRVVVLTAAFAALNGLLVGLVDAITHGWFVRIAFEWPTGQPCCEFGASPIVYAKGFVEEFSIQFLFGAFVTVAIAVAIATVTHYEHREWHRDAETAFPIAVFTVLALAAAVVTRRRLGAAPSHDLGFAWGLVLLGALGYRYLRRSRSGSIALIAVLGLALIGSQLVTSRQIRGKNSDGYLRVPSLVPTVDWNTIPADLVAYGKHHRVFHPNDSDVSVQYSHSAYPTWIDLTGFMYAGRMPDYLGRLIVQRRFDLAFQYTQAEITNPLTSDKGKYEQNFLWKINRAIELEYRADANVPAGGRVPIAGRDPAPWLSRCFGPYVVSGIPLRQHVGGGFWCPQADTLTLRETPAAFADVRSATGNYSGTVSVSGLRTGSYRIQLQRASHMVWQQSGSLAPGQRTVTIPTMSHAQLSLGATRGSRASFDLAELHRTDEH